MDAMLAENTSTTLTEDSLLNIEQDACSVFQGSIELLDKFCTDHINALCDSIAVSAKAKSWDYRRDRFVYIYYIFFLCIY